MHTAMPNTSTTTVMEAANANLKFWLGATALAAEKQRRPRCRRASTSRDTLPATDAPSMTSDVPLNESPFFGAVRSCNMGRSTDLLLDSEVVWTGATPLLRARRLPRLCNVCNEQLALSWLTSSSPRHSSSTSAVPCSQVIETTGSQLPLTPLAHIPAPSTSVGIDNDGIANVAQAENTVNNTKPSMDNRRSNVMVEASTASTIARR
mmetsp:Transcript_43108/g.125477  ORF Transcript_43108/g.125477 Transcript_43108/m.125477 type:complete len:207 (-) Transcript_43108:48-668(-)